MNRKKVEQIWRLVCRDAKGNIKWIEEGPNDLADEGESQMLDVYYRGAAGPTQFYVGLFDDTPLETDGLLNLIGEPSGGGYARQLIERSNVGFPTLELNAGDFQVVSKTVTFTASGGSIGPVTYAVLATTIDNTGLFVAFKVLSQSRTLADGESLDVQLTIKQQ